MQAEGYDVTRLRRGLRLHWNVAQASSTDNGAVDRALHDLYVRELW